MEINVHKKDNKYVFDLDGSLDIYTSLDLKSALEENVKESNVDVCINLEKLNYIDSSGIGILIKSLNYIQSLNGTMCVANLKPSIEKIFKVSGLTTYFEILTQEEFEKRYGNVIKQ
ncbi:MAG: anti-sigma factor antagonist [Leptospiraceae bacterium]|nr:MAG: anti-sigma factor antagonist [Leptospiraceae bacterium]